MILAKEQTGHIHAALYSVGLSHMSSQCQLPAQVSIDSPLSVVVLPNKTFYDHRNIP